MSTLSRDRQPVKPASDDPSPPHRWETELRAMLRSLEYPACNVTAAVSWVEHRGQIDGCPVIDVEDWTACNAIVRRADDQVVIPADNHRAPSFFVRGPDGRLGMVGYRAPRGATTLEPSTKDRAWWAAESARLASVRVDAYHDSRATSSCATGKRCLGLMPHDVAEEIAHTRRGGFLD
jgi:hypothetical protein